MSDKEATEDPATEGEVSEQQAEAQDSETAAQSEQAETEPVETGPTETGQQNETAETEPSETVEAEPAGQTETEQPQPDESAATEPVEEEHTETAETEPGDKAETEQPETMNTESATTEQGEAEPTETVESEQTEPAQTASAETGQTEGAPAGTDEQPTDASATKEPDQVNSDSKPAEQVTEPQKQTVTQAGDTSEGVSEKPVMPAGDVKKVDTPAQQIKPEVQRESKQVGDDTAMIEEPRAVLAISSEQMVEWPVNLRANATGKSTWSYSYNLCTIIFNSFCLISNVRLFLLIDKFMFLPTCIQIYILLYYVIGRYMVFILNVVYLLVGKLILFRY